jgi:hypothetical protein
MKQRKYSVGVIMVMDNLETVRMTIVIHQHWCILFLVRIGDVINYEIGQFLHNQELVHKWRNSWMKMKMKISMENKMKEIVVEYILLYK